MAATAFVLTKPVRILGSEWLGRICLQYVSWLDARRTDIWKSMTLELTETPAYQQPEGVRIEALADERKLGIMTRLHNRAYVGASDYTRAGWIQRQALRQSIGFDPTLVWIAFAGEKPVGYCMGRCRNGKGRITGLAVLPEFRRRKIGTALMQHALAELGMRGAEKVCLEVPRPDRFSQALYGKLGFRPEEEMDADG